MYRYKYIGVLEEEEGQGMCGWGIRKFKAPHPSILYNKQKTVKVNYVYLLGYKTDNFYIICTKYSEILVKI